MKLNAMNSFEPGESIFTDEVSTSCMVLKGKVEMSSGGCAVTAGVGALIGSSDASEELGGCVYTAKEPVTVYAFTEGREEVLRSLLSSNKEYGPIMVASMARIDQELWKQYRLMCDTAARLRGEISAVYGEYTVMAKKEKVSVGLIPEISQLEEFSGTVVPEQLRVKRAAELSAIPYEDVKAFFGHSVFLSLETVKDLDGLKKLLTDACIEASDYIASVYELLIGEEKSGLYYNVLCTGVEMREKSRALEDFEALAGKCLKLIGSIGEVLTARSNRDLSRFAEEADRITDEFRSGKDIRDSAAGAAGVVEGDIAVLRESLNDSLGQLFEFAGYSEEKEKVFRALFDEYAAMQDKESTDDGFRTLRRNISEVFFDLYEKVFLATVDKVRLPKAVELFLDYGYLSETLLDESQITSLLRLSQNESSDPCVVYTMREWLMLVYNGDKEPSRNDMGQDYADYLRELKKQGKIDEKGEKELLKNGERKLGYEIKEVLSKAIRTVNGQLSTFVPILHSEQMIGDITKAFISRKLVNETVKQLLEIDYSIFHRESLYIDPDKKIEKEYMMKQVFPVFVMYPTIGQNAIMWQEITGRRRDSEGRFFVPVISFTSLTDMLIKAFGQYRWSLCKTIQGTNWNNIQVRSLTSEYSDYIQFYKKNKDLSEERREKIKLQLQRGRNNLREVFTLDYIAWIKNEAAGAIKLNKVAREIIATWCPFSAGLKEQLVKQPLYEEAFARNTRERNKKVHELDMRYRSFESKGIKVPKELSDTLVFYRDL